MQLLGEPIRKVNMNNNSNNIIKRQLHIIRYLMESNYVSTLDIQSYLKSKGIDAQIRTIQRDLNLLNEIVPLEVRTDDKPYSWRWRRLENTSHHTLTLSQALALRIVETKLEGVIPSDLYSQLTPLFVKSHFVTGLANADDEAVHNTSLDLKIDFVQMSPLQRIVMNIRAKTTAKVSKFRKTSANNSKKTVNDLSEEEKGVISSLGYELKKHDLGFLDELLNR